MLYPLWTSVENERGDAIKVGNPDNDDCYNILDYCQMILNSSGVMRNNYAKYYFKYFRLFVKSPITKDEIWKLIEQQVLNEYTETKKLRNSLFLEMFTELRVRLYNIIDDIVSDDNTNLRGQIDRVVMEEMNSLFKLFAAHNIVKIRLAIFNELPLNHVDCLEEQLYNEPTNIESPFDINIEFEE